MKIGKRTISAFALLLGANTAIAFNTNNSTPDFYYLNSDQHCVAAPCETVNNTGKKCITTVYTDQDCRTVYESSVWAADSGD